MSADLEQLSQSLAEVRSERDSLAAQLAVLEVASNAVTLDAVSTADHDARAEECSHPICNLQRIVQSLPAKGREVLEVVEAAKELRAAEREHAEAGVRDQIARRVDITGPRVRKAKGRIDTALSKLGGG